VAYVTLKGKVVIVTGRNSGIEKAYVLALAQEGANIVIDCVANEAATEEIEKKAVTMPINLPTLNDPQKLAKVKAAFLIGRMAEPEEMGNVVAFLAGDGASYLAATTVTADGGLMQSRPGLNDRFGGPMVVTDNGKLVARPGMRTKVPSR
jgi:NAD(P)-dependent dehydrogenase (short-subunit alcohol dehydrogenase family)